MTENSAKEADFGFRQVPLGEKQGLVDDVFHSVARRYDLMNDLMSGGLHRLWKRAAIEEVRPRPGQVVLDLAGGTGDLARVLAARVGEQGHVVLADINMRMLERGRDRLIDDGVAGNVSLAQVDAEALPFRDRSFDAITMAFGLRNVTDKTRALQSMRRVLKPGGRVVVLEFSKPAEVLRPAYDFYSFNVLPALGRYVAGDEASYRYLAESIRMHPDQETLLRMMEAAGFEQCRYRNLSGGIVALHVGWRL